jgi:PAS domain S-box-containing protein
MKTNPNFPTRRLLAMTTIAIITIYMLLMFVLPFLWSTHRNGVEALAESVLVGIAATLILYRFWYRPLVRELVVRDEVERTMRSLQEEFAASAQHRSREVTELKTRLQSEIMERVRLMAAVQHAPAAMLITDGQGRITHANAAFEQISGFSHRELSGATTERVRCDNHQPAFDPWLATVLERAQSWQGRLTNRKRDGTAYQAGATVTPIPSNGTNAGNVVVVDAA